jgi:hypothetical protein
MSGILFGAFCDELEKIGGLLPFATKVLPGVRKARPLVPGVATQRSGGALLKGNQSGKMLDDFHRVPLSRAPVQ